MKSSWKDRLDKVTQENLKDVILLTAPYKDAIAKANDPAKAQIWLTLAILNERIKLLELKNPEKTMTKKELNKLLKSLETL